MGADIHMVLEKRATVRDREVWIGVNAFPYVTCQVHNQVKGDGDRWASVVGRASWFADDRNYSLFAALAGVRGSGPDPKGLPDDASDLTLLMSDRWGDDGHSHSWMLMGEALPIFLANGQLGPASEAVVKAMKTGTAVVNEDAFAHFWPLDERYDDEGEPLGMESLDDFRLCFWFDN